MMLCMTLIIFFHACNQVISSVRVNARPITKFLFPSKIKKIITHNLDSILAVDILELCGFIFHSFRIMSAS